MAYHCSRMSSNGILIHVIFLIAALAPQQRCRATWRESRSIELDKLIHNNDGQPIDMIFDKEGETWMAVGEHHDKFNNLIGQTIRDVVPLYYPSWNKVLAQFKEKIVNLQRV